MADPETANLCYSLLFLVVFLFVCLVRCSLFAVSCSLLAVRCLLFAVPQKIPLSILYLLYCCTLCIPLYTTQNAQEGPFLPSDFFSAASSLFEMHIENRLLILKYINATCIDIQNRTTTVTIFDFTHFLRVIVQSAHHSNTTARTNRATRVKKVDL